MDPIRPFYLDLDEAEIDRFSKEAGEILRGGMLILGDHTDAFEKAYAEYVGTKHAIAVNSGTSALEILLRMKGVEGKTVLVPTNTNFASVAAVLHAGGHVEYLDMDPATFAPTLDMVKEAVDRPRDTELAGIIWVHIGGVISHELPAVIGYAHAKGLFVIEDAAHAHGSMLGGRQAGALGDGGAFSFFPTKVMTTCEGGMITTDRDEEDELARSFRNQGKRGAKFGGLHHDLGGSLRITELGAAMGRIMLEKLPAMLDRREAAANEIIQRLEAADLPYARVSHMDKASHYKLVVLLPEGKDPAAVKQALSDEGVMLGGTVYELPCHKQPVFEGRVPTGSFPMAERWCPNHICPPLTSGMSPEDGARVGDALVKHLT